MTSQHDRPQLSMADVSTSYGDRTVLDQVSLTVRPGEKAGVIGENGSGKSTLLRLMAGAETPDGGDLTVRFPGGTGYLAQTLDLDPRGTVQDAVDAALSELREMEGQIRAAEARMSGTDPTDAELAAYGDLLTAYEARGGYQADARTDAATHGLGLGHVTRDRVLGTLSGGELSRLALACVLAAAPELLLLDEPTNHLDADAVSWLEDHLRAHRGTLVAVTHDRAFLERTTTVILEVDRDLRAVTRYGDGWQGYRAAKAAARRRQTQEHQEWLTDLARTEELADAAGRRLLGSGKDPRQGFGKHRRSHEAKLSGQVRAARTRLEALRGTPVPAPPRPLRFTAELATAHEDGPGPDHTPDRRWSWTPWSSATGCACPPCASDPGSGSWSPGRTGRARPPCCGSSPGISHRTPAPSGAAAGPVTSRRSCPSGPHGARCSPRTPPAGRAPPTRTPTNCWTSVCSARPIWTSPSPPSPPVSSAGSPWPGWSPGPPTC